MYPICSKVHRIDNILKLKICAYSSQTQFLTMNGIDRNYKRKINKL